MASAGLIRQGRRAGGGATELVDAKVFQSILAKVPGTLASLEDLRDRATTPARQGSNVYKKAIVT